MMTKGDLEKLALLRLEDAIFLLQATRFSSAYYLAGYAVELALNTTAQRTVAIFVVVSAATSGRRHFDPGGR